MSSTSCFDSFVVWKTCLRWYSRYSRYLRCLYFLRYPRNFLYSDRRLNRARNRTVIISDRLSRVDDNDDVL